MKARNSLVLLLVLLMAGACASEEEAHHAITDYPNAQLLIEAPELAELLQHDNILLIDAREEHSDSLIQGAIHFPAINELTDPDHPVENFLIGPEVFQEKMRQIGLSNNDRVVLYDGGNSLAAARLFLCSRLLRIFECFNSQWRPEWLDSK